MLNLTSKLTLNQKTFLSPNLCDQFTDDELAAIGRECWEGYNRDERSRSEWLKRNETGMDLALQISKDKSFPWPDCSNVQFPLVTIAGLQFHARAYPAIVGGTDIVKCTVFGADPDGMRTQRAQRVSGHMSWQLLYEDDCWEDQEDKALLNLSIVGTNFKKIYYSPNLKHNVSELVLAKDLVLNYWSKSVESAPRKTHKVPKFRNEVHEAVLRGLWRDVLTENWYLSMQAPTSTVQSANEDTRQGTTAAQPDDATPLLFLEQHCNLDLDQDGYAEPYIVTFGERSKEVVRIVCNFETESAIERVALGKRKGDVVKIEATQYFIKKTFIPSPDGGIYDIGFGVFLGPLNESVNSIVNMLLDAGTMQTTAGGFLGRGAKIRGGTQTFAPFEWKRVDATGDDLRKSIMQLPVNAPSNVLFQLLSLLINYTNRVSGTTDMMVGENPGQNTPATTAQTMVEMGQKIYTAIFKRIWRSSKEEFQLLYKLNGLHVAEQDRTSPWGVTQQDYQGNFADISPVADPQITSDSMGVQMAGALKQAAASTAGYNHDEVERRFLKAMKIDGIDAVFPGTEGTSPPEDPKVTLEKLKGQNALQIAQLQLEATAQEFQMTLLEEQRVNNAKIIELMAKAENASANAQTEQSYAQVALINAEISSVKVRNEALTARLDHLLKAAKIQSDHTLRTSEIAKAKTV